MSLSHIGSIARFSDSVINGTIHSDYLGTNSPFAHWTYQSSRWSNIETINASDSAVSITPFSNPMSAQTSTLTPTSKSTATPISSPTVPEFTSRLVILPFFVAVILISKVFVIKRMKVK